VTTDRTCYAAGGDAMQFSGQGFTAGAEVAMIFAHNGKLGSFTAQADAAGAFTTMLRAPELKAFGEQDGAFDLDYTANDQSKFGPDGPFGPPEDGVAVGSVRISDWSLDIAAWNGSARGQWVKLVTTGWTSAGDTLCAGCSAASCRDARFGNAERSRPRGVAGPDGGTAVSRVGQSWSPAVADIIAARRAWTVAISSVSMLCR
jgi:hypothetical protein